MSAAPTRPTVQPEAGSASPFTPEGAHRASPFTPEGAHRASPFTPEGAHRASPFTPEGAHRASPFTPEGAHWPRLLAGRDGADLAAHLRRWGRLPALPADRLLDEVDASGLTGRGGSGFPISRKLQAVKDAGGVVVINATEGEPASAKDKTLLRLAPHLVLDGAALAAAAVGASDVVLAVERNAGPALEVARAACAERRGVDRLPVQLAAAPGRYLAGQETALVHWLNGADAKPTAQPPRPTTRGVGGRPTVVSNAETLAHLALVARFGASWFRSVGSAADPGSTLVTVSGAVARPGVYELPLGAPLTGLLATAGAAPGPVLLGGYYGTWLPAGADVALTRAATPSLGAGVVAAIGDACPLAETARLVRWLAGQGASQCGPCANGLPAVAAAMDAVAAGEPTGRAEAQAMRWCAMIDGRGACHLPDGAAGLVRSALDVFADEVARHRWHGPCRSEPILPTPAPGAWR